MGETVSSREICVLVRASKSKIHSEKFDFNDDGPCGLEGTEGFQEPGRVGHGNRIRDVQISIWNRAHKKGDHCLEHFMVAHYRTRKKNMMR